MFENLFESPLALIGLVLIPILIILYLLKPKPREFKFPTLMFIMDIEKKEWFRSFLKKLIKDPVLLIQILIIALLVFAVAEPFYTSSAEVISGNIILIIDLSASMQASDLEPDRFSLAIDEAREITKKSGSNKITIVTSSDTWSIQLREGTNDEAVKILSNLKCDIKPTNIAYSMLSAKDVWKNTALEDNEKKIIYVISDFAGKDVLENVFESKSKLEQEGIIVILKRIGVDGKNIGVIDVESYRVSENKCLVKFELMNYNKKDANIEISVDNEKINEKINSNSRETFSKEISCKGKEKIEIKIDSINADDDLLKIDNIVFIPTPEFKKILFISDDNELKNILKTISNLKLTEGDKTYNFSEFDIVVTDKIFDKNKIAGYVKSGGNFIFTAPDAFYKWEYDNLKEILPVEIEMDKAKAKIVVENTKINANIETEEFKDINFNKYFLEIKRYYVARNNNATILATANDNNVLIAKNARMFYVGFNSKWTNINEIPTDISYPALWYSLIKSMIIGTKIDCLCNERESDIMPGNLSSYETQLGFETMRAENKNYIFNYLLILGLIFLLIEMYYLKVRGQV